ncbi:hypothetical protein DFH01_20295 [Falsiroseomonas bella]|uniref:NnrS family protein n=1 Tax=Falsiroseomonas bella TaxID=2184016 RepID=A0A317FD03_9PROT|nr:NnrS family protein [Falsiroseomonas bella]PWS35907.1 hypothetical protein DFH01_20295 [Falsiroseomonas bella]
MKHPRFLSSHRLMFGLATAQGAVFLLAWVLFGVPLSDGAAWHAHEMIFGQAIAVIGGYLLSSVGMRLLAAGALAWLAARAAILVPGVADELRAALSVAATATIVLPAARAFLRGVKRPGNVVFPVLLGGFVAADALFLLGQFHSWDRMTEAGVWLGLGLVVLLIAAMGGRLLSAAASGAAQRGGGGRIPPRPGLEAALLGLLAAGFVAEAAADAALVGATLFAAGGVLLGYRVALWIPGLRRSGGDVLALAAGQLWLGLGFVAWWMAAAGLIPLPGLAALHLATIGGIGGTLLVMTMRAAAQREGRAMPRRAAPVVAGLMGAAAIIRAVAPPDWGWPMAVTLWTGASLVAAAFVFRAREH